MKSSHYFDYAATTPVDPRVALKMAQCLTTADNLFGNPSSTHMFGLAAKQAIDVARAQVADLIQADPSEIIWTSGATEANNLALKGAAQLYKAKGKHIVTMKTEHPSVLDCCQQLEKEGFSITTLSPQKNGLLDLDQLRAALRPDTILVSVMHVNNEIGIIQDIPKIADLTSSKYILLHVDAAQSVGKIAIDLSVTPVDLMTFSAHKLYGPKGMGALYLRRKPRVRVAPQIHGGGHEHGMRSGTLATHQIVGMGEAFHIAKQEMQADQKRIGQLRERFLQGIQDLKSVSINSDLLHSIPNIVNVCFAGIKSEKLMQQLPHFALSAGSACHSKGIEPSYVLRALGQSAEQASCAVRFSFGRFTTVRDVDLLVEQILALKMLQQ
jgi:cysteine desulfurase